MAAQEHEVRTQREAAEILGLSRSSVAKAMCEGCPAKLSGRRGYDVEVLRRWFAHKRPYSRPAKYRRKNDPIADDYRRQYDIERTRLLRAQVERLRFKNDRLRASYMPIEEVRARDQIRVAIVKKGLSALVKTLASELPGLSRQEMETKIIARVRETLQWFSMQ